MFFSGGQSSKDTDSKWAKTGAIPRERKRKESGHCLASGDF
jgi:hypothetical protein